MEPAFWHERWRRNETAFHEGEANRMLMRFHRRLPTGRIFVPLCGKTRDIAFLLQAGYSVVGAELSRTAVEELFTELNVAPTITPAGKLERFSADAIDVFVGDVFGLDGDTLGHVDAVYDRAALVALPPKLREKYATHIAAIAPVPQLVICFEYDQSVMDGPPFSVDEANLDALYGGFQLKSLAVELLPGGLKGVPTVEHAWLLRPNATGSA